MNRIFQNFIIIITFIVLTTNNDYAQKLLSYEQKDIFVDNISDKYDCLIINDTVHLVLKDRYINYYKIFGSSVEQIKEIKQQYKNYYNRKIFSLTSDLKIFLNRENLYLLLDLLTSEVITVYEFKNEEKNNLPLDIWAEVLFCSENKEFFVYEDESSYKPWISLFGNMYAKNYLIDLSKETEKNPLMIQEGNTKSRSFQGLFSNDTLYMAWAGLKQNWFSTRSIIELLKYDGNNLRKMSEVLTAQEAKNYSTQRFINGLYKIKDDFFIFWHNLEYRNTKPIHEVYFKSSADGYIWSDLKQLPEKIDFISVANSENEKLYILAQNDIDQKKYLYIFDGETITNLGEILGDDSFAEKILINSKIDIYIFGKKYKEGFSSLYFNIFKVE